MMFRSDSDFGFELHYKEEMALRIALERSKVETGASPQLPQRRRQSWTLPARTQRCQDNTVCTAPASSPFPVGHSFTRAAVDASAHVADPHAHSRIGGARRARSMHGRGTRRSSPRLVAAGWRRTLTRTGGSSHGSTAGP